ncbi:cadherin [Flavobacterium cyanobacteriorum]|uniref:Cadherin n=1 Tax=Flavobacterium cyanobacteriorum TaxID=2022802 RepID=A0A255Z2Q3_9FLAO|nr:PQQ-dependent sugar dehydrogenase [Flavobacterium cyanobacteriorum]OYQ35758.1 cadherin [Flavobacterium cyanobacteriorum]
MKKILLYLPVLFSSLFYGQTISLTSFATGFTNPTEITHAGDSRLFVVQQGGLIRILNSNGTINTTPFLNVTSLVSIGSERGLLGLAFHPQYATNGFFYINYTNTSGNTVVARYTRSASNPDVADAASAQVLLTITQPFSNHNGGCLRFGPDGFLYISLGDGGSANDPQNNGQDINTLLGKMLRIDVNNGTPYSSPAGNPFVGVAGADEIWATGLRNAWKFSFNRLNGDMWIADVGQNQIEEINKVTAGSPAGLNFGWRCYEGNAVFNSTGCGPIGNYTMPFAQYSHSLNSGCSVTGGYVYTGTAYPNLQGKYLFADYCNNRIGIVNTDGTITFTAPFSGNNFSTFGEDINGELYIGGRTSGTIYKIVDTSAGINDISAGGFAVYPNPASGSVNIKNPASGVSAAAASIFDLSGKLLLQQQLTGTDINTVPLTGLPAGFYMLGITDNNGNETTHKLMLQ